MIQKDKSYLTLTFFDVGHGDSVLVEFPDGKHLGIIDCHSHAPSNRGAGFGDESKPKVLVHLSSKLTEKPDYVVSFVCLSHYHIDHYRGMGSLIRELLKSNIPIREFWDPGVSRKKFDTLKEMAEKKNPETIERADELCNLIGVLNPIKKKGKLQHRPIVKKEQCISVISDVRIDVIAPYCNHWSEYVDYIATSRNFDSKKEHLVCSAIMMTYGQGRVILGSDLSNSAWGMVIGDCEADSLCSHVVKVSHHGSEEGNFLPDGSLWEKIAIPNKTVAVISGGYRSDIPLDMTIQELKNCSVMTYCTGNFLRQSYIDPTFIENLSPDAKEHYMNDSKPLIEGCDPYHGDVRVYMDCEGQVEIETEFDISIV